MALGMCYLDSNCILRVLEEISVASGSPKLAVLASVSETAGSNAAPEIFAAAVHSRRAVRSTQAAKCRAVCLAVSAMTRTDKQSLCLILNHDPCAPSAQLLLFRMRPLSCTPFLPPILLSAEFCRAAGVQGPRRTLDGRNGHPGIHWAMGSLRGVD